MNTSQNAINILACKMFKGIGPKWISKNIKGNESTEELVEMLQRSKVSASLREFEYNQERVSYALDNSREYIDGIVAIGDDNFPIARGNTKSQQELSVLCYKGDISLISRKNLNIAVIGLLKPDEYIEQRERNIVSAIVKEHGATIVSGLANGCDEISHNECLSSGGKTVAILPNTLGKIMPSSNKKLADEIVEKGGLLVTEYYNDISSRQEMLSRYVERDRLQALFSDGIILSASYEKNNQGNDSGSRHAMQYAKDYDILRAVIYNESCDSDNPQYALNKQIKESDSSVSILNENDMASVCGFMEKVKSKRNEPIYSQLELSFD